MPNNENVPGDKPKPMEPPRPLGAFRFEVRMNNGSTAMAGFTQFSGVKMKVDTLQARSGNDIRGVQEYVPIMTHYEPVVLSKGVIGNNEFLSWLFDAAAGMEAGPMDGDPRTLNVVVKDETGEDAAIWVLKDAIPIAYELSPMNGGRSELLSENLTFAIHGVQRILVKNPVNKDAGNEPNPKRKNPPRPDPNRPAPPHRKPGSELIPRVNPPRPNPERPAPPKKKSDFIS